MENKTIYLSPSLQEYNVGYGDYGTEEYRMNRIADILEKLLKEKGYIVYRNKPQNSIQEVVKVSNILIPDIHIALHSNASAKEYAGRGIEIYVNKKGTKAEKLAQYIYDEMIKIYPDPKFGRGVFYSNELYELRETTAPAVLIEVAFHDNVDDAKWIINNEKAIAIAISNAIDKYFEK